ncbi:MAG: DNA-processing protein DprA, partial [Eubacterium sp.]|nr:DNA-processing protein DprA [Eubacterium sp.]
DIVSLFLASGDEIITRIGMENYSQKINRNKMIINIEENDIKKKTVEKKKRTYHIPAGVVKKLADSGLRRDIAKEYRRVENKRIRFITKTSPDYPEKLRRIPDPPEQLFVIGSLPDPDRKAIGIVGARECTPYGRDMARLFGYRLAQAGMAVISGMALGVDGWAHRGALDAGGYTYAILGNGVEKCVPGSHEKLYRDIPEKGGVISEYPTTYGALAQNFPMRNRIISGLSDGILVVEARIRSGSLITADRALDQGRDVFVVPGRIGDTLSVGCNRLIRQGAIPVLSPNDILEYYGIEPHVETASGLTGDEARIYQLIGSVPVSLMTLADSAQGSYANTLRVVAHLKKAGLIREVSRDRYIRN